MEKRDALIDLREKIVLYNGQFVMLDADVADVYGVQTKEVNQAVRNNPQKFPEGYVITPEKEELANLRSKILTTDGDLRSKISTARISSKSANRLLCRGEGVGRTVF